MPIGVNTKLNAEVLPQANQLNPLPTPDQIASICQTALAAAYPDPPATVTVFHNPE